MNIQHHKEIISQLEKIPEFRKEYIKLENSISDKEGLKNKLSKEMYQTKLLNFELNNRTGAGLKNRMMIIGNQLNSAKPDFTPSHNSVESLERYVSSVGRIGVSERIKKQIELMKLLEMQKLFASIHDFLDEEKIKTLNKYLKEVA